MSHQKPSGVRSPQTILIASAGSVSSVVDRLPDESREGLQSFSDVDIQQAVQAIVDRRPSVVVLEQSFASTPRGGALVNRIRFDEELRDTDIQVVSMEGAQVEVQALPPHTIIPSANVVRQTLSPPDYRGTRQVPRVEFDLGVLVKIDGDPATVVDMSRSGAQVLVTQPLRPFQRVRVWADRIRASFRCDATVVWVHYELHIGPGGYYRAGLSFANANPKAIDSFCAERGMATAVA